MGKTDLIFTLFKNNYEIINADSMQVYKGMDIGSAKPSLQERTEIPHHLIDCMLPSNQFNAGIFVRMANHLIPEILKRGKIPVISGGTAYYFKSFLFGLPTLPPVEPQIRDLLQKELITKGLPALYNELKRVDPLRAEQVEPGDSYRILRGLEVFRVSGKPVSAFKVPDTIRNDITPLVLGLERSRPELYKRINMRVDHMIEQGLIDEVKHLIEAGYTKKDPGMKGIGYGEFFLQAETGEFTTADVIELIKRNSRRYAKRQYTFFRKLPMVKWFCPSDTAIAKAVKSFIKNV